jgi:hypothetical protein
MQEVEDLKDHLARSKVNVSADMIKKAIVLPEEWAIGESARRYPKLSEMLF